MKPIIAKLLLISLALASSAQAQTLQLRLPLADAGPGTSTASDTNLGTLNVTMNMFSNGTVAVNLHGAAGTGITNLNLNAMALDLTTNNVPSQLLTEPGGSSDAGPILKLENSAALATGLGNGGVISNFMVTFWMKSVNTLYGGNTPRLWILAPGTTAGDFDGNANGMGMQYQTSSQMYFGFGGGVILNFTQPQPYPINQWMFFAVAYDGTNFVQYYGTDMQAATAIQTVASSGKTINLGAAASLVIGNRDSSYTRSFNGWMTDFRIYNGTAGSATAGFVQNIQYQKLTTIPVITSTSRSQSAYTGTTIDLSVTTSASGLTYQWQAGAVGSGSYTNISNGGQFSGATSNNLVISNVQAGNQADYVCVATSGAGSITNDGIGSDLPPITLTVSASEPQIVTDINPTNATEAYVGQTVTFSATFAGSLPMTFQWMVDTGSGPTPISSASNPSALSNILTLANVQLTNAGIYSLAASNAIGGPVSSSSSTLTVLADPAAPVSGTYGALIVSNNPIAYWRFNETEDPSTGILPAYDATGHGFVGLYGQYSENGCTNAAYFSTPIEGPQSPAFPGFETNNTAVQTQNGGLDTYVTVPPLNPTNTNTFTITIWINPAGNQVASEGLFLNRNGNDAAGLVFGHAVNSSGVVELGYNWNNNAATYNYDSHLFPPLNQWSLVALVIQPSNATIYLYYIDPNTLQPDLYSAVNPVTNAPETFNGGTTLIGSDPGAGFLATRSFNGAIDEVAVFNTALSNDQLLKVFSEAAGLSVVGASIASQPQSLDVYAGETVSFIAAGINGTAPITLQWDFISTNNVTNAIPGATNATLTVSNVAATNVGSYQLFLTNPAGTTNSLEVTLAVVTAVPNSYESIVLANNPLLYWKLNETNDPSAGGVVAYDYVNGYNGVYQTAAQNGFDGILGPQPPQFPGFSTNNTAMETFANTANSYMTASAGSLTASNLTYAMWINPSAPVQHGAGLLFDRGGAGEGFGFGGNVLDTNNAPNGNGMSELYYAWNQNSSSTYGFDSFLYPPTNQWSFVALVIQPTQTTMYMMNSFTGIQSAVNALPNDTETFGVAWHLGDDAQSAGGARTFPGSIDEVSVYLTALSSNQLVGLYYGGLQIFPPVTLYIAPAGAGNLTLTWSQGALLQATNLTGPWTTNTTAVSPYTLAPTNSHLYFKVLVN